MYILDYEIYCSYSQNVIFVIIGPTRNHFSYILLLTFQFFIPKVKAIARREVFRPAAEVVETVMRETIQPNDHHLPKMVNLTRAANLHRQKLRPSEPVDLSFVVSIFYIICLVCFLFRMFSLILCYISLFNMLLFENVCINGDYVLYYLIVLISDRRGIYSGRFVPGSRCSG